jgi:hypothetical protein
LIRSTVDTAVAVEVPSTRAGAGGLQRHGNGLQVAHLADQDDVGIRRAARRAREARGVRADLALVDHRLARDMDELDRVFEGDDVRRTGAVDQVDHRGEGGRLAGPGGAGDQHQPLGRAQKRVTTGGMPSCSRPVTLLGI